LRDAGFVALFGVLLMFSFSYSPALAFKCGATVALAFSIGLIFRTAYVTDTTVSSLEAWRAVEPKLRPDGDQGRANARDHFEDALLRTSKSAAMIAIGFYSAALCIAAVT
jgi:hypothetical protein